MVSAGEGRGFGEEEVGDREEGKKKTLSPSIENCVSIFFLKVLTSFPERALLSLIVSAFDGLNIVRGLLLLPLFLLLPTLLPLALRTTPACLT